MPSIRINELTETYKAVTQAIESKKIEEASLDLLKILGKTLECSWGTFWWVDSKLLQLCPMATWSVSEVEARDLERDTKSRTLSLSEGTAGHVWKSQKLIWTLDLVKDMCLPRSLDADSMGLHGGIWFPIKTDTTVYAVVELLGKNLVSPTEELVDSLENFGIKLGYLLEDKMNSKPLTK